MPVSPAAHYVMGGVETDLDGRTSVPNLFAAGEVASTGVHGANRLASNSLLEGLVFGARAAQRDAGRPHAPAVADRDRCRRRWTSDAPGAGGRCPPPAQVQDLMWRHVGLSRDEAGLRRAVASAARVAARRCRWPATGTAVRSRAAPLGSLVTVGTLIAHAALRREESRGGHFRTDFPRRDDLHWQKRVADVRQPAGTRPTAHATVPRP